MEASYTVNTDSNTEQLVQNLVMRAEIVHTESTTVHQISKDTNVPSHDTYVPSHGTVLSTDTVMKNGTEKLVRDSRYGR